MFFRFLVFQWKTAVRSPMWQKNLVLNLIIGFFLMLMLFYLVLIGLFFREIILDVKPGSDPFRVFNGLLLYYFVSDFMIRFMMQNLPRMNVESFLHLPLRKSTIVHFMVGRTSFDIFNFIPLFVLVPATFTLVIPEEGSRVAAVWLLALVLMVLGNNYLITWLKRMLGFKPWVVGAVAFLLILLVILDKTAVISVSGGSSWFFGYLCSHPVVVLLPAAYLFSAYFIHYSFLKNHLFPDEVQKRKAYEVEEGTANRYLRSLGLTGTILQLEMKLYWRNKRTRTMIYMLPIFLLYGFFFYPRPEYLNQAGWLMFVGVFMTGGMMINYANYAFAYESSYFDALLTKQIDFRQYIRVKYYVAVLICTFCYILTIPYFLFGLKILLINTAMYLYNIGILAFVMLYFSTYNKKRMDLTRGGAFNYQGIGALNWLAVLPAFLLPVFIYLPFTFSGYPKTGIVFIALTGVLGLFLGRGMFDVIARNFYHRKYVMAQAFRERY